jgi:hypothetical protein
MPAGGGERRKRMRKLRGVEQGDNGDQATEWTQRHRP